jgi:hypothetical protein
MRSTKSRKQFKHNKRKLSKKSLRGGKRNSRKLSKRGKRTLSKKTLRGGSLFGKRTKLKKGLFTDNEILTMGAGKEGDTMESLKSNIGPPTNFQNLLTPPNANQNITIRGGQSFPPLHPVNPRIPILPAHSGPSHINPKTLNLSPTRHPPTYQNQFQAMLRTQVAAEGSGPDNAHQEETPYAIANADEEKPDAAYVGPLSNHITSF